MSEKKNTSPLGRFEEIIRRKEGKSPNRNTEENEEFKLFESRTPFGGGQRVDTKESDEKRGSRAVKVP